MKRSGRKVNIQPIQWFQTDVTSSLCQSIFTLTIWIISIFEHMSDQNRQFCIDFGLGKWHYIRDSIAQRLYASVEMQMSSHCCVVTRSNKNILDLNVNIRMYPWNWIFPLSLFYIESDPEMKIHVTSCPSQNASIISHWPVKIWENKSHWLQWILSQMLQSIISWPSTIKKLNRNILHSMCLPIAIQMVCHTIMRSTANHHMIQFITKVQTYSQQIIPTVFTTEIIQSLGPTHTNQIHSSKFSSTTTNNNSHNSNNHYIIKIRKMSNKIIIRWKTSIVQSWRNGKTHFIMIRISYCLTYMFSDNDVIRPINELFVMFAYNLLYYCFLFVILSKYFICICSYHKTHINPIISAGIETCPDSRVVDKFQKLLHKNIKKLYF